MSIKRLTELFEKGYDTKSKFATLIATQVKEQVNAEIAKIRTDQNLTPAGQDAKIAELKKEAAKAVFEAVAKEKTEYVKVAAEATALAKKMKTEGIKPPADATDVKLFEQELASLQTSVMLAKKADTAIQAIDAFQSKYSEHPYYANEIKTVFPSLIQSVTAIDNNPIHRAALGRVYSSVEAKTITPEISKADEMLSYFSDGENVKIFRHGTPQFETIKAAVGSIANHINEPEKALGIANGEIETFAGIAGANVME